MAIQLSQNHWPILTKPPAAVKVPGTNVALRVRSGDVAVILIDLANRFHMQVERLDLPGLADEWGWAYRPIRGQNIGFSNHASGTAIDLNATRHPRGVKGTFTDAKERAVRTILASYMDNVTHQRVVRWGEEFVNSPVDGMHFEINAGADAVKRVADRIRKKSEEELMATPTEIALAVLHADVIPNKNAPAGSRNPTWTLASMVSDIENTQDEHTADLKAVNTKLDAIVKQLATLNSLLANKK